MKLAMVVLFLSEILMAGSLSLSANTLRAQSLLYDMQKEAREKEELKNADFSYCLKKGAEYKEFRKDKLNNFLDQCIMNASNNLEGNKGASVCLKVAELGNKARLTKDCNYQVGYQICRDVENDDFYNRVKCMALNSSSAPYASCGKEISELKKLQKEKAFKLTSEQTKQFQKVTKTDFCETPARGTPQSPDEGPVAPTRQQR